jgi:hypothetical protein
MMHRDDLCIAMPNAVDDPIGAPDKLPQRWIPSLRYDAARLNELLQLIDRYDQTRDENPGVCRGVAADVFVNGVEVLTGLRRPVNSAHGP